MASVSFTGVGKVYPDGTRAVADLNLDVADGEFLVLVGPSGCGKTTALRMVAGLEEISEGQIVLGDEVVNDLEPRKRDIAMVFQNYALYPHMNVFDNIAFPLRSRRMSRREIEPLVDAAAKLLGLEEYLKRRPGTLSGGQRQRVAMGRALIRQPQVFLMDEPLSNLDAKLRVQMRAEISKLQRDLGVTTLYVTHDQVEAMTMGTGIAVMRKGVLQQHGRSQDVYDRPVNLFVATFIGSPAMNLFHGRIEEAGDGLAVMVGSDDQTVRLPATTPIALRDYRGRKVAVGIRPEHLIAGASAEAAARLVGEVVLVEALGAELLIHFEVAAEPVVTDEVLEIAQDTDAAAVMALREEARSGRVHIIARADSDARIEIGQQIAVAARVERFHFFDIDTGRAVR
jgi:multiple sugar transport system ATP-binding protein